MPVCLPDPYESEICPKISLDQVAYAGNEISHGGY